MGTNYYIKEKNTNCCPNCGFGQRHIGKASYGWHFMLRVYPEDGIMTLDDWKNLFYDKDSVIHNEYKDEISPDRMMELITLRRLDTNGKHVQAAYKNEQHFCERNNCEPGFNNLYRPKKVFANGDGPFDYFDHEFS